MAGFNAPRDSQFIHDQFPSSGYLFDPTPAEELFDQAAICDEMMDLASRMHQPFTRKQLRLNAISRDFGRYSSGDYKTAVGALLKQKRLYSATAATRINDDVLLQAKPFGKT